jgi:hypothetical protein
MLRSKHSMADVAQLIASNVVILLALGIVVLALGVGSLHALAVADLNGDGLPEIIVNEQEELLPESRQNPRWVAWENLGHLTFREHVLLDTKLGGHELQAGDVDGDGDSTSAPSPGACCHGTVPTAACTWTIWRTC